MDKIKSTIKDYCPPVSLGLFIFALLAAIIQIVSELSTGFSDFFNRYIGSFFRGFTALLTNLIPFSAAECLILFIPVLVIVIIVICFKRVNKSTRDGIRYTVGLTSVAALLYSMFVMSTAVAYNGTPLANKLGLEQKPVSVAELRQTAEYMIEKMNQELDNIKFKYSASSIMPYSIREMNNKLLDAYDKLSDKYPFIPRLWSRVKQVSLSEAMTYTHMSGMYTYYTGEANININFPDYSLPFTAAHELAHQRGILPENEANFIAFLVCCESDDPYIRYSGYMNMFEYLSSALYSADYNTFAEVYSSLDARAIYEIRAYNAFFEKYRDNTAAKISSTLNDNYLKSQGQTAGEKSYGMVVDLAVAYVVGQAG
jgi:hypothetical protein